MKITVEYDDIDVFNRAHNSDIAWSSINTIENMVRNQLKHGDSKSDREILEQIKMIVSEAEYVLGSMS